ncbi:MAG: TolC family protein, partial [Candidatus Omnitrophica bacterium]|nr:TolC family protein [Candidatus Omnitrophota bacterium]
MTKPPLNERVVLLLCVFFLLVSMTGCASSGKDVRKDMAARETKHSEEARSFAESYALDRKEAEKPAASGVSEAPKVSRPVDSAWSSIRRRMIDTSKPLALAELVDIALRNNPSTRQAWYNASVELAKKKQEEAVLFPAVTVSSSAAGERQVATRAVNKINQREYSVNAELTYLLFDFGGRSASIEEMVQTLSAANFQYNQSVQDLVLTVEKGYYDFYSAQSAYDAAQSDVATSKKDFEAARARFEAGVAVKLDVLQAQSDYEDALYSLEVAKGDFKNSRALLAQSLGLAPDTEFQIALPSKELPKWIMGDDVSLLIERAVMERHDLASSRATLLSKKAAVRAANSDLWPTFNLGSTVGRDWYDYRAGNGQRAKDYNYSGFLQMIWNLFDGFYLLNKKR